VVVAVDLILEMAQMLLSVHILVMVVAMVGLELATQLL
jgi:hypothetical protein